MSSKKFLIALICVVGIGRPRSDTKCGDRLDYDCFADHRPEWQLLRLRGMRKKQWQDERSGNDRTFHGHSLAATLSDYSCTRTFEHYAEDFGGAWGSKGTIPADSEEDSRMPKAGSDTESFLDLLKIADSNRPELAHAKNSWVKVFLIKTVRSTTRHQSSSVFDKDVSRFLGSQTS